MKRFFYVLGILVAGLSPSLSAQPAAAPPSAPTAAEQPAAAPAPAASATVQPDGVPAATAAPDGTVPQAGAGRGRGRGGVGRGGRGGFGGRGRGGFPPPEEPVILPVNVPGIPSVVELALPAGATAVVDGKDAGDRRTIEFKEFDSTGRRRVEIAVTFADGTTAQRAVDLEPGLRIRVPVAMPPVDQPTTILTDSAVAFLGAVFSPDGRRIATAAENKTIVIWDLTAGRAMRDFSGHQEAVQSVVFSSNGEFLLTSSVDTTAIIWNVESGKAVRKFKGHAAPVNSAVFSKDGKRVLTGSTDKTAILWDAETGAQLRTFTGHTDEVVAVAISPDGRTVATGSTDRNAMLWNAETGERLFPLQTRDTVSGVVFSPDGKHLLASNFSNSCLVWEVATGTAVGTTRSVNLDLNGIAISPDGRRFFSAGKDSTAKEWDTATRQMVREFTGHGSDLQSVACSPDGKLLLTASRDGTVRLWDIATGVELASLAASNGGRTWAVVAPDGLYDASEAGRRMIGYRFASKLPGASVDQFFSGFYRPGLLAQIHRGERPMAASQLGRRLPPVVKIVAPKVRSSTEERIVVEVEAIDAGGGISAPKIFNNGARLAIEPELQRQGETVRYRFPVSLVPGNNLIRVTAASDDGSWESMPAELELTSSHRAERKSRLFVVGLGIGDYVDGKLNLPHAAGDARALADLLQRRSAGLYDRVDVVSLSGKDATRSRIKDTLLDVASLTQPQDTVVIVLSGRGAMLGDHLYMAPSELNSGPAGWENELRRQGLDADDLAAWVGTAKALNRVLILDATDASAVRTDAKTSNFALRAAVERWSRAEGVYAIAACAPTVGRGAAESAHGLLAGVLLDSAGTGSTVPAGPPMQSEKNALGVTEWFNAAAERAMPLLERLGLDPQLLQPSTKPKGFPLLVVSK